MTEGPHSLRGRPAAPGAPRISLMAGGELTSEQARLHEAIVTGSRGASSAVPLTDEHDRLLGPFAVMLLSPAVGGVVQELGAALRFAPDLPPRTRELAILTVAAARGSEFEWLAHEGAAREVGLGTDCLQALLDAAEPPGLSASEQTVVRVVRQLVDDGALDDDAYTEGVTVLGRPVLATLVWLVGYYSMLATALATFRPPGVAQPGMAMSDELSGRPAAGGRSGTPRSP